MVQATHSPFSFSFQGYCYSIQRQRGEVTDWQCSVRPKVNPCRAIVRQHGDHFQRGNHIHNHQAQVGALMSAKITSHVKAKAVEDILKSAPAIVDEVIILLNVICNADIELLPL